MIIWIFIGNWIFLNLFLAILLDGFTETAGDDDDDEDEEFEDDPALEASDNEDENGNSQKESKAGEDVADGKNTIVLPLNKANLKKMN
jgi:hypothetical protein